MTDIDFTQGTIYPDSVVIESGTTYFLARLHENRERCLGIVGDTAGFGGTAVSNHQQAHMLCRITDPTHAEWR